MTADEKEVMLSYLPLVYQIAYSIHRHLSSSVDVRDLIGYGVLALTETPPPDAYKRCYLRLFF